MKIKLNTLYRSLIIDRQNNIDTEKRTAVFSFSSETPYERFFGLEVLDHAPESVDLSRLNDGAPLLLNHNTDEQIGVVESAWLENKRGMARVRFSANRLASEVFSDIADGIRRNISVGYVVKKYIEERDEKTTIYRAVGWLPLEVSVVSVPADATVGLGRDADGSFDAVIEEKFVYDKVRAQYSVAKYKHIKNKINI